MREMKDSGVEWIGVIPSHWKVSKIKQVIRWKSVKGQPDLPVLSLYRDYGIIPKDSRDDNHNVTSLDTSSYKVVECGDLVINKMKAWQGSLAVSEYNGIVSPAYHICQITSKNICKKYLHYLLRDASYLPEYMRLSTGLRVGQWDLSFDDFKNIPFLLPPLAEQERIAAFLDAECAEIDTVLEKTRASIEEYKKLKQAVITQAVTKGVRGDRPMKDSGIEWIGDIPAEWDVIRVKQLLKEHNERSKEGKEEPLSMSQKVGLVPTKFLESIPNMASSFVGAKLAYVDDLVFNKLKAHLGVFSVSRYDGLVSPDYAVYCSTGKSNLKYLEYIFKTPQCIGEFRKKSTGIAAGLMRLYTEGLFSIYLPYPALSEQEEIAEYLNEKCTGIDALIVKKQQYLTEIENYKKSLIYEYVTGKKEVLPL